MLNLLFLSTSPLARIQRESQLFNNEN